MLKSVTSIKPHQLCGGSSKFNKNPLVACSNGPTHYGKLGTALVLSQHVYQNWLKHVPGKTLGGEDAKHI